MIITALNRYYEILAADPDSNIPPYGFSATKVSFEFVIDDDSKLVQIIPLEQKKVIKDKEYITPKVIVVPQQVKKTGNVAANFLCDNANYVLGINREKDPKDLLRFDAFKELHHTIIDKTGNQRGKKLLRFLDNYTYDKYLELFKPYEEAIAKGGAIVFRINGKYLHEEEELKEAWLRYQSTSTNYVKMQCSVTGQIADIARIHPSIKGVKGAKASGASLVSFNDRAYESYTKAESQGLNSPISEKVVFNYTTVLNYLLSQERQKLQIGDTTIIFWAETTEKRYNDFINILIDPPLANEHNEKVVDREFEEDILSLLKAVKEGKKIDYKSLDLNPNTKFCILGISPNSSRLSIRFFYSNNFGKIVDNLLIHFVDMYIEKKYNTESDSLPIWLIAKQTIKPAIKEEPNPLLTGSLIRAIITGEMYPQILFNTVINRIRYDQDLEKSDNIKINYPRVSIIKAYLSRYARIYNKNEIKEVLTLGLNEQTNNKAYLLGRLFAILEKAQRDALGKEINATIKDRYFSSACATPAAVFPTLLKLAQSHISKAEYGYVSDNRISEVINKMEATSFPAHLSLEEQGIFIIGYYHQNNAFFKKGKKEKEGKGEQNGDEKSQTN